MKILTQKFGEFKVLVYVRGLSQKGFSYIQTFFFVFQASNLGPN